MTEEDLLREQAEYEKAQIEQFHNDLVSVLTTDHGRRVWLWIANDLCGLNKRMPIGQLLERMEGRRDVAIDMADVLSPYPDLAVGLETVRAAESAAQAKFKARSNQLDEMRKNR